MRKDGRIRKTGKAPPTSPVAKLTRLTGWCVMGALLVINLLLLGYVTRSVWLMPLAREIAEAQLSEVLAADVTIRSLGGNLIDDLVVEGFEVRGGSGPLRNVDTLRLAVGYDLRELLAGKPIGLRRVSIEVARLDIRLPDSDPEAESSPLDLELLVDWLDVLPDGAEIQAARLRLENKGGDLLYDGPASVGLTGREARRLLIATKRGDVQMVWRRDPELVAQLDAQWDDPGVIIAGLGGPDTLEGGRLELRGRVSADAGLTGSLEWRDGRLAGEGPARVAVEFDSDTETVSGSVDVVLPGLRVDGDALRIPRHARSLDQLRGEIRVDLRGRGAWETLLPDVAREYLPAEGKIRASVAHGDLYIDRGRLEGPDWSLEIDEGRLPLRDVGDATGLLSLSVELVTPRRFELGDDLVLEVSGRATGLLQGSLSDLDARAQLDLGAGSIAGWRWSGVRGDLHLDDDRIELSDLELTRCYPVEAAVDDGIDYSGLARIDLPTADQPLAIELAGEFAAITLAASAPLRDLVTISPGTVEVDGRVELPAGSLPRGKATLRFDQLRAAADRGPSHGELRASIEPDERGDHAYTTSFDGRMDPLLLRLLGLEDARLERTTHAFVKMALSGVLPAAKPWPPTADLELAVSHLTLESAAPLEMSVQARLDHGPDRISIKRLECHGPLDLDVRGTLDLEGDGTDLLVRTTIPDTTPITTLVPGLPQKGQILADIEIDGSIRRPDLKGRLEATLADTAVVIRDWPAVLGPRPRHGLELRIDAEVQDGVIDLTRLEATVGEPREPSLWTAVGGIPPVRWTESGLEPYPSDEPLRGSVRIQRVVKGVGPVSFAADVVWSASALNLHELAITSPRGAATGLAAIDQLDDALLADTLDDAQLTGHLDIDDFDLGSLAGLWQRGQSLTGSVSGTIELGGTVGAPAPTGTIELKSSSLKLAQAVPAVDDLNGRVKLDEHGFVLEDVQGKMGLGEVRVHGSLQTKKTPWLNHLGQAQVDVSLDVDDALLLRSTGIKMRADAALRAHGPINAMLVKGDIEIAYGKLIRRVSLVPNIERRGGVGVDEGVTLFSIPPPLGPALRFDVSVRTRNSIDIVTHVVNAPVDAALALRGNGVNPRLEGVVSTNSGILRMPAVVFAIDQALLRFSPENPRFPTVQVNASARRHSINIKAAVTGSLDSLEIILSSVPPLTQSELVVLSSTGQLPDRLREQSLGSQATMVGSYVASEIFDFYFGSDSTEAEPGFLERFQFSTGREISRNGTESMTADFDLDENWAMRMERDMYEDYNMGVVYRIRW